MIRILLTLPLAIMIALLGFISSASASDKTFVELKCNKCHTVSALGIEKAKKAGDDDEEDEDEGADFEDLSSTGKRHDAAFLAQFLKKEVANTKKDGSAGTKKHKAKFKGTDAQLTELTTWLASLKK